jgi:hypothetical protein
MALLACVTITKRINCLTSTFIVLNVLFGAVFVTGGVLGHNSTHQIALNLGGEGLCSEGKDGEFGGLFTKVQQM